MPWGRMGAFIAAMLLAASSGSSDSPPANSGPAAESAAFDLIGAQCSDVHGVDLADAFFDQIP